MKYQIEKTREEQKKSKEALVQLYLNSKTWAEFKVTADVEVPVEFEEVDNWRIR